VEECHRMLVLNVLKVGDAARSAQREE